MRVHRPSTSPRVHSLSGMSDRHSIWRAVARNYKSLEEHSPDGYVPVVEAHVGGEAVPVVRVETSGDDSWVMFHSLAEGKDGLTASYATDRYLFVQEAAIGRVEIRFVREGNMAPKLGFSFGEIGSE